MKEIYLKILLVIVLLELTVLCFGFGNSAIERLVVRERTQQAHVFGANTEAAIEQMATGWFRFLFVESELKTSLDRFIFEPWHGETLTADQPDLRGADTYLARIITSLWTVIYLVLYRLAANLVWLPVIVLLGFALVADAVTCRQKGSWRVEAAQPFALHMTGELLMLIGLISLTAICLPITINPIFTPLILAINGFLFWLFVVNLGKST